MVYPAGGLRFDAVMIHGEKITLGQMRSGAQGVLIYCSDFRCSHSVAVNADQWPDQRPAVRHRAAVRLQARAASRGRPRQVSFLLGTQDRNFTGHDADL